jgi:regulator of chromosome condensation
MILPILEKQKFVQVACGVDHVLALTVQGHVWVWGNGQQGQLGRKIIERRKVNGLSPERLALRKIKLIGTGWAHSFAVDHKGAVFAWGLNTDRQTGVDVDNADGEEEDTHQDIVWEPTEVKCLNPKVLGMNRRVVEISGGESHTLFRISDGSVYACGRCDDFQLGFGSDHPSMKAKRAREELLTQALVETVAEEKRKSEKKRRKSDQTELEMPNEPEAPLSSVKIHHIAKPALIDFPCGDTISAVSANGRHNLALSRSFPDQDSDTERDVGAVFSWGLGLCSQLGLGKDTETGEAIELASVPRKVESAKMKGWKVEGISAGGQHCVLVARPLD